MEHFARRLREIRRTHGLTQRALAERAGMAQPHIARLEGGQRYRVEGETIIALCKALGCSSDYLLGLTDKESGHNPLALTAEAIVATRDTVEAWTPF